jgi:hypothetical protein
MVRVIVRLMRRSDENCVVMIHPRDVSSARDGTERQNMEGASVYKRAEFRN